MARDVNVDSTENGSIVVFVFVFDVVVLDGHIFLELFVQLLLIRSIHASIDRWNGRDRIGIVNQLATMNLPNNDDSPESSPACIRRIPLGRHFRRIESFVRPRLRVGIPLPPPRSGALRRAVVVVAAWWSPAGNRPDPSSVCVCVRMRMRR